MSKFFGDTYSYVYRGTDAVDLEVISTNEKTRTQEINSVIHKSLGNNNYSYERVATGDEKLEILVFIKDNDTFNELREFFLKDEPFIFFHRGVFSEPLNLEGNLSHKFYSDGCGELPLVFTNAVSNKDLPIGFPAAALRETLSDKKNYLDSLRAYAQNVYDFTGNINEKIGGFTNNVSAYSNVLENLGNGVGNMSTIVTNPINSIRNSTSNVIGGITSIITGFQNAVAAITALPSNVDDIIDEFNLIGERLSNLFVSGTKQDQVKQSLDFIGQVGESFVEIATRTLEISPDVSYLVYNEDTGEYTIEFRPEFYNDQSNSKALSVNLLASILLQLYRNSELIDRWNEKDLNILNQRTEIIYQYLIAQDLSSDLIFQLDIARNQFFTIFTILKERAFKLININLNTPRFLFDLVYEVNGNYDNYYDTKKYNNIVGGVAEGKIYILSNE